MDLTDRMGHPDVGDGLDGSLMVVALSGERVICDLDTGLRLVLPIEALTCTKQLTTSVRIATRVPCPRRSILN